MSSSRTKANRVAIVGASSLRGREVKLILEDRNFPASDIILLDEPTIAGTLTEAAGEPTFFRALEETSFAQADDEAVGSLAHADFFASDFGSEGCVKFALKSGEV